MARTNSCPQNYWRNYFGTAKDPNIFSIIEHAIKVAASDSPADFSLQRDRIVARLSSIHCLGSDEESDHAGCKSGSGSDGCEGSLQTEVSKESKVTDEAVRVSTDQALQNIDAVFRIKEVFQNRANEALMIESLTNLKMMAMTVGTLEATEIGKVVNVLKKHGSKQIRDLARTLVDGWKVMVGEYLAKQESSSDVIGKQKKKEVMIKKQEVVAEKPNKGNMQRLADEAAMEAKLKATKRKLHERYEQIQKSKKQKTVQVLELSDIPKKGPKVISHTTNRYGKKPGSVLDR